MAIFINLSSAAPHLAHPRGNTIGKVNSRLPLLKDRDFQTPSTCGVRFVGGRAGVGPKELGAHLSKEIIPLYKELKGPLN
jgi:hypothetical protein